MFPPLAAVGQLGRPPFLGRSLGWRGRQTQNSSRGCRTHLVIIPRNRLLFRHSLLRYSLFGWGFLGDWPFHRFFSGFRWFCYDFSFYCHVLNWILASLFCLKSAGSGCPGQSEARKSIKELPKHHKKLMFFCLF
ncbi:MAG: hypothetical protein ABGY13_12800 [Verrucomicrobiia bacterium]